MPIGAFAAVKEVMNSFMTNPVLGHITTFGGHPVSAAAALAAIRYIKEEGLTELVESKEKLFRANLEHPKIFEIRGKGLLLAVEIGSFENVQSFIKLGLIEGFISDWFIFHDSAFRIAPPLNISDEEIIQACTLIKNVLDKI